MSKQEDLKAKIAKLEKDAQLEDEADRLLPDVAHRSYLVEWKNKTDYCRPIHIIDPQICIYRKLVFPLTGKQ